jgi:hypothetical protein
MTRSATTLTRSLLTAAAALGALVLAQQASAQTPQPLTVYGVTDAHAWATAPGDWKIESCFGRGYDADGDEIAYAGLGRMVGEQEAEVVFDPHTGVVVDATVECDLYTEVVTRTWHWVTKHQDGVDTSSRSRSAGCFFRSSHGALKVACRGGSYAVARYRFPYVPGRARHVSRSIVGYTAAGDRRGGTIRRTIEGSRGSVTVTGRRMYVVTEIRARYQAERKKVTEVDSSGYGTTLDQSVFSNQWSAKGSSLKAGTST